MLKGAIRWIEIRCSFISLKFACSWDFVCSLRALDGISAAGEVSPMKKAHVASPMKKPMGPDCSFVGWFVRGSHPGCYGPGGVGAPGSGVQLWLDPMLFTWYPSSVAPELEPLLTSWLVKSCIWIYLKLKTECLLHCCEPYLLNIWDYWKS